jgi:hypothetical protein
MMLLINDNTDDVDDVDDVNDTNDTNDAKANDNQSRKKKDHVSTLISIESSDS